MNEPQVKYDKFTTFANTTSGKVVIGLVIALALFLVNLLTRNTGFIRMLGLPIGGFFFGFFFLPGFLIKQADKAAAAKKETL
jgi:hypothetical protein